jgi:hypothetical protein
LHVIATPEIAKSEKLKSVVRRVQHLVFRVSEVEEAKALDHGISEIVKSGIPKRKRENSQCQLGVDHGVHAGE